MADKRKTIFIAPEAYVTLQKGLQKQLLKVTDEKQRATLAREYWNDYTKRRGADALTFVEARGEDRAILYPLLDEKPVTWEVWFAELEKLKNNPFGALRLTMTEAKTGVAEGRRFKAVSSGITAITGGRGANTKFQKLYNEATKRATIPAPGWANSEPTNQQIEEYFTQQLEHAITNKRIVISFTGNAGQQIALIFVDPEGTRHLITRRVYGINSAKGGKFRAGVSEFKFSLDEGPASMVEYAKDEEPAEGASYFFDVGHEEGDLTKRLRRNIQGLEKQIEKLKKKKDQVSINTVDALERAKEQLNINLKNAEDADRSGIQFYENLNGTTKKVDMFGVPLTLAQNEYIAEQLRKKTSPYLKIVTRIKRQDGEDEIVVTEDTSVIAPFKSNAYKVEWNKLNSGRGSDALKYRNIANQIFLETFSSSPLSALLARVLGRAFKDRKGSQTYISKNKPTQKQQELKIPLPGVYKPAKLRSMKAQKKEAERKVKSSYRKFRGSDPFKSSQGMSTDILSTLNAQINDAVIQSMGRPALVNRTGRFASSVKIDSVVEGKEEYIINYLYQRSPYDVFSQDRGRSPWNSIAQRDPEAIINNAISQVLLNKFGSTMYFMTRRV